MRRVITCAGWTCGLKSWSRRSHRWRTRLQSIAGQSQLTKRQASCAQWTGGSGLGDTAQEARPHLTDAVGAVNLQARRRRTRLRGALGTQLAPWRPEGRSFRSVRSDRLKPLKGLTGRPTTGRRSQISRARAPMDCIRVFRQPRMMAGLTTMAMERDYR